MIWFVLVFSTGNNVNKENYFICKIPTVYFQQGSLLFADPWNQVGTLYCTHLWFGILEEMASIRAWLLKYAVRINNHNYVLVFSEVHKPQHVATLSTLVAANLYKSSNSNSFCANYLWTFDHFSLVLFSCSIMIINISLLVWILYNIVQKAKSFNFDWH